MAKSVSELIGLKEANRALKKLPEFAREEAQETFNVTAYQFARMAAAAAPKDTGRLAESISWAARPRSLSAVVLIHKFAFYWKFQEFGTVHHGAHPFLRPTAIRLRPDHQARLESALGRSLGKMERESRG